MVTASQTVTIERHEWPDGLVALTFADPTAVIGGKMPRRCRSFLSCTGWVRGRSGISICACGWRGSGFRACAVDVQLHGERQSAESALLWGERTSPAFLQAFGQVALGTAAELSQIADDLGASAFGIVGHSMGGYIALLGALSDRRTRVVVNVGGSLDSRLPPALVAQLPPAAREFAARLDPVARAGEFWPTAVLLLHGAEDTTVPVVGARLLHQALVPFYADAPERLRLTVQENVGHELNADAAEQAIAFLRQHLLP